jgi:monofunctional biosynthetic peptidoglycan transglycosylase
MSADETQAPPADQATAKKPKRHWWRRLLIAFLVITIVMPVSLVLVFRFVDPLFTWTMVQRAIEGDKVNRTAVSINAISPNLVRAVIAAEDNRFCSHDGFDFEAIQDAMAYNERAESRGSGRRRGASTISQQTAKNIFLWQQRSWFRKGLETYFTVLIEVFWPKRRIMEAYLNAAEWGDGAFGAEAAARVHFNKSAKDLTRREAARLAAVLPNPRNWNASEPGPYVRGRARSLQGRAASVRAEALDACVLSP